MTRLSGTLRVHGRVALCFQEPWLVSRSVRDNILFGLPHVPSKLDATVRACAMTADVNELVNGLDTIVGERGVSLSGGQRARLSLGNLLFLFYITESTKGLDYDFFFPARAVYSNADIYLLDDPLAALDAHVGKQVFDNCISGILKGKTRVLVTHQVCLEML